MLLLTLPIHGIDWVEVPFTGESVETLEPNGSVLDLKGLVLDTEAKLVEFPVYGKQVPSATGRLKFSTVHQGCFPMIVSLEGLAPDHAYILTLNGNPERAGNQLLPTPVPGMEHEKYYDFKRILTDENGKFDGVFAIDLPPGAYDLRFYVKDTSDFRIVLFHDFFRFEILEN